MTSILQAASTGKGHSEYTGSLRRLKVLTKLEAEYAHPIERIWM